MQVYSKGTTVLLILSTIFYLFFGFVSFVPGMESTLQEERNLKLQVEEQLLQLKKEHSMLDCDHKQAEQKLEELQAQKEKLSEEVTFLRCRNAWAVQNLPVTIGVKCRKNACSFIQKECIFICCNLNDEYNEIFYLKNVMVHWSLCL